MTRGFKPYKKAAPCRECIYRKKSAAEELLGSFQVDDSRYYFVLNGQQYYCQRECQNEST